MLFNHNGFDKYVMYEKCIYYQSYEKTANFDYLKSMIWRINFIKKRLIIMNYSTQNRSPKIGKAIH